MTTPATPDPATFPQDVKAYMEEALRDVETLSHDQLKAAYVALVGNFHLAHRDLEAARGSELRSIPTPCDICAGAKVVHSAPCLCGGGTQAGEVVGLRREALRERDLRLGAESHAASSAARVTVLECHVQALVAWMDEFRDYLNMVAVRFPVEEKQSKRAGATWYAARAALASATVECGACGGNVRYKRTCPACSGTGRASWETAGEVLREAIEGAMGLAQVMPDEEAIQAAVGAALARLAARAAPSPSAEVEALLACRRAVEAREALAGDHHAAEARRLALAAGAAHTAAVAALKAMEEADNAAP